MLHVHHHVIRQIDYGAKKFQHCTRGRCRLCAVVHRLSLAHWLSRSVSTVTRDLHVSSNLKGGMSCIRDEGRVHTSFVNPDPWVLPVVSPFAIYCLARWLSRTVCGSHDLQPNRRCRHLSIKRRTAGFDQRWNLVSETQVVSIPAFLLIWLTFWNCPTALFISQRILMRMKKRECLGRALNNISFYSIAPTYNVCNCCQNDQELLVEMPPSYFQVAPQK